MDYEKEYLRYKAYAEDLEKENLGLYMRIANATEDKPLRWQQYVEIQANRCIDTFVKLWSVEEDIVLKSAENAPIVHKDQVIGTVREYHSDGRIDCVLWDKVVTIETVKDGENKRNISAVTIR